MAREYRNIRKRRESRRDRREREMYYIKIWQGNTGIGKKKGE